METRSIAAACESRLTSASCPDIGMGEVHARLAVLSTVEGLASGAGWGKKLFVAAGEGLAAMEAWVLGAEELPHAASIRTRARPAPLMPSKRSLERHRYSNRSRLTT